MKDKVRKDAKGRFLDNPDGVRTTKESLFDMHEDMQTVDAKLNSIGTEEKEEILKNFTSFKSYLAGKVAAGEKNGLK